MGKDGSSSELLPASRGRLGMAIMIVMVLPLFACEGSPAQTPPPSLVPTLQDREATESVPVRVSPTIAPTDSGAFESPPTTLEVARPTPTPTSLPTPTATPWPGLIGPGTFGPNVNPLTGQEVANPATLRRRPLAIKISNVARVRPQSGLSQADVVFEHLSEGGITRLTAIFYSRDADRVGSIRSARLIDLEIPLMFDAGFGYSGSSLPIKEMIRDSSFVDQVVSPDFGHDGFYRISEAAERFEDTMFTDTFVLRAILQQRGQDHPPELRGGVAFHPDPPPGGTPASQIELKYSATSAFWYFNPSLGRYQRWSDGERHLDANNDEQLSFDNVVVIRAHHQETEIVEDSLGSRSIQIQIWGQGPLTLFRDGLRYDGQWRRGGPDEMLSVYDEAGNLLPLSPGTTFFQIVPIDFERLEVTP